MTENVQDDRTAERGYLKPHPANRLQRDAYRLRDTFDLIDADVEGLIAGLAAVPGNVDDKIAVARAIVEDEIAKARAASSADIAAARADAALALANAISGLTTGAPDLLNTFAEVAAKLASDDAQLSSILSALAARLRLDAAQSFNAVQQAQGRSNLGAAAAGVNSDITELANLKTRLLAPGLIASGFTTVGCQIVMRAANFSSGWRQDNSATYLLITNQNDPDGTFNSLRPLTIDNRTGALTFDGTGGGTRFGGNINTPANIQANSLGVSTSGYFGGPLTASGALNIGGVATVGGLWSSNGGTIINDIHTHRNNDTGYTWWGNSNRAYMGWDGGNMVVVSPGGIVLSGGSGVFTFNGATVWHSGNFDPNSKVGGDNVSVIGYNSGNVGRPYINGGPGYRDLVFSAESYARSFDAGSFSGRGRMLYGRNPDNGDVVYAAGSRGNRFHSLYFDDVNLIFQVDTTGFALARLDQSDARLKNVEGDLSEAEALRIVEMLKPTAYAFKPDEGRVGVPEGRRLGFIAQDLQSVSDTLVKEGPTLKTEVGEFAPLHLQNDASIQLVSVLTKALQSALRRIDRLENARV